MSAATEIAIETVRAGHRYGHGHLQLASVSQLPGPRRPHVHDRLELVDHAARGAADELLGRVLVRCDLSGTVHLNGGLCS